MTSFGTGLSSVKINPSKEETEVVILIHKVIVAPYLIP